MIKYRLASELDIPLIKEVYEHAIDNKLVSHDKSFIEDNKFNMWFDTHRNGRYPIYIVTDDDVAIGFTCLSPFRDGREAFEGIVEVSIYLSHKVKGRGYGDMVICYIVSEAKKLNYRVMVASLIGVNIRSIDLFERNGFKRSGVFPNFVKIDDNYVDYYIYTKHLT